MLVRQKRAALQAQVRTVLIRTKIFVAKSRVLGHKVPGVVDPITAQGSQSTRRLTSDTTMAVPPSPLIPGGGENPPRGNDKVKNIMTFPEIPVGGRLTHFLKDWEQITQDKWVLEIVKQGYKLEFKTIPVFNGIIHSVRSTQKSHVFGKSRIRRSFRKKCDRNCSTKPNSERFLQYVIFSTKKERGNETSHKSKTSKSVSSEISFQNGHNAKGFKPCEVRR